MTNVDPNHGNIRRRLSACFLLLAALSFFHPVKDLCAKTGLSADAAVAKVADLGIIETAPAVLGRDGGYSVLFQNRSIWIYGDTIVKPSGMAAPALLSNSCSWTEDRYAGNGISGFKFCQDEQGIPLELFPFTAEEYAFNRDHGNENCRSGPCGVRWALWPGAAVSDDAGNRLLLFFKKVLVKPEILNFETRGHGLAVWHRFNGMPERIRSFPENTCQDLMFCENEPAFGSAALAVQSMLYVFGCNLEGFAKPCRLARVPLKNATNRRAWEYYGISQKWQKEIGSCEVVLYGNDMMSVSYNAYLRRYLAVYSQPMSTGVMLRTAINPEGPWSKPLKAFDARPPVNDIGWIYDAMEHPEYAQKNGEVIYVTYSRQTGPFTFEMRLVALTLQRK